MKFTRIRLLIIIAISLIVIGGTGTAITYYTSLDAFFRNYQDYQQLNQAIENASRYTISEVAPATAPTTVGIVATGGTITVEESNSTQIELDIHLPYQPNKKAVPLLKQDGDILIIDTATIWSDLTGDETQPVLDIDIRVPAGTSLDIRNTVGDIELNGTLNTVTISIGLGSIKLHTPAIESLDATFRTGGDISGEAAKSSIINVNLGSVDLHVSQPGTHTIRASTGEIDISVADPLTVATTYRVTNGEFSSQVPSSTADNADVIMNVAIENGDIDITPR
jgi:hypothetical protein